MLESKRKIMFHFILTFYSCVISSTLNVKKSLKAEKGKAAYRTQDIDI